VVHREFHKSLIEHALEFTDQCAIPSFVSTSCSRGVVIEKWKNVTGYFLRDGPWAKKVKNHWFKAVESIEILTPIKLTVCYFQPLPNCDDMGKFSVMKQQGYSSKSVRHRGTRVEISFALSCQCARGNQNKDRLLLHCTYKVIKTYWATQYLRLDCGLDIAGLTPFPVHSSCNSQVIESRTAADCWKSSHVVWFRAARHLKRHRTTPYFDDSQQSFPENFSFQNSSVCLQNPTGTFIQTNHLLMPANSFASTDKQVGHL